MFCGWGGACLLAVTLWPVVVRCNRVIVIPPRRRISFLAPLFLRVNVVPDAQCLWHPTATRQPLAPDSHLTATRQPPDGGSQGPCVLCRDVEIVALSCVQLIRSLATCRCVASHDVAMPSRRSPLFSRPLAPLYSSVDG